MTLIFSLQMSLIWVNMTWSLGVLVKYSGSSQTYRRLWNIRVKAGDVQWEDKSDNTCLSQSYTIPLTVSAFLEAGLETTPLTRDLLSRSSNQIPKSYMYSWRKTGGGREKYSAFRNQSLFPPQALWWYSILKHLAGALSPACFFSILPASRGCITGPVQTESCNYPECHLIAAPLSAASPRASPLYIGHTERERERERDVMIALWAGISLNFTMFLIHPIISSQCPAFSIHFSFSAEADVMSDTKQKAFSVLCMQCVLYGVSLLIVESGEFFGVIRLFPETQVSVSVCRLYRINSNRSIKIHSTCTLYIKTFLYGQSIFVLNML